jgi:Ca2+-binding RTX toxin-like protein
LEGDQGNLIDGGAGDDFIAAGTGADYVHGGADNAANNFEWREAA